MNPRPLALVTGASAGLGAAFARALAARGCDLVLVARRVERLERLAAELRAAHAVSVEVMPADLAEPTALARVESRIRELEGLEYLVNNAGFGVRGYFDSSDIDGHSAMVRVHILATLRLTYAALSGMLSRKHGWIINVSSLGAFMNMAGNVNYNATKAYLNTFTEGLARELAGTGVKVQALCPGFTLTEFHDTPDYAKIRARERIPRFFWDSAERVVEASLRRLPHGPVVYVPFIKNQVIALGAKLGMFRLLYGIMSGWFRKRV
jgi:short-subunit dehydrogenase